MTVRGVSDYRYYGFLVYSAAFYAPSDADLSSGDISRYPCRLVLHYQRTLTRADFVESGRVFMEKNPSVRLADFEPEMQSLEAMYDDMGEGDEYQIDYSPDAGLSLMKNGVAVGRVSNPRFAVAYLGIWLSEYGISSGLREDLLAITD